jgi:hypothetical protein
LSDGEAYRGTKDGRTTSLLEARDSALSGGRGTPHYYLLVTNEDINQRLDERFNRDWNSAEAEVFDLFQGPTKTIRTAGVASASERS